MVSKKIAIEFISNLYSLTGRPTPKIAFTAFPKRILEDIGLPNAAPLTPETLCIIGSYKGLKIEGMELRRLLIASGIQEMYTFDELCIVSVVQFPPLEKKRARKEVIP
jgi:hypothetical protein